MSDERRSERRTADRRRPTVILEAEDAERLMRENEYTGCFIGHAARGKIVRIEIPNPAGWAEYRP